MTANTMLVRTDESDVPIRVCGLAWLEFGDILPTNDIEAMYAGGSSREPCDETSPSMTLVRRVGKSIQELGLSPKEYDDAIITSAGKIDFRNRPNWKPIHTDKSHSYKRHHALMDWELKERGL